MGSAPVHTRNEAELYGEIDILTKFNIFQKSSFCSVALPHEEAVRTERQTDDVDGTITVRQK